MATGIVGNAMSGLLGGEQYEFKILKSRNDQFYWTLHNTRGNTEPVAQSETYTSKQSAHDEIRQIMRLASTALVTDKTK
jgi:uncharacterized protein YegP (UPF0339 family)